MLKWLIRNRLAAFERTYGYDVSYARQILDADTRAFLAFAKLTGISRYARDVPRDVYFAAKIAGAMHEDCGPCTQLVVTMALRAGMAPVAIASIVQGLDAPTEEIRIGASFARAVLTHDLAADELRDEIVLRWGARALVAMAFAVMSARMYPTLKYALGHGKACRRIVVAGEPIAVRGAA